jgi:acetyl esterase/lipase
MAAAWTPPDDVLTRPAPLPDHAIRYGTGPELVADVRLPAATSRSAPLVIFLHGGFWRAAYDRSHTGPMATALAAAGYAVCVPEFRRTGQAGGGWPGTFEDVAAAVDRSPALVRKAAGPGVVADDPALLAGHSAGGHLALWAAGRHLLSPDSGWHADTRARGVVVLAGVSGLADCYDQGLGNGAAADLMGGSPARFPQRYRVADPAGLLPLGCPVRLVHGSLDDVVPAAMSRGYAALGRAAGDDTAVAELPGASHLDLIDPPSPAWPQVLAAFKDLAPVALSSP